MKLDMGDERSWKSLKIWNSLKKPSNWILLYSVQCVTADRLLVMYRLAHTKLRCLVVMRLRLRHLIVIFCCRNASMDSKWSSTCSVERKENTLSVMPSLSVLCLEIVCCSIMILTDLLTSCASATKVLFLQYPKHLPMDYCQTFVSSACWRRHTRALAVWFIHISPFTGSTVFFFL